MLMCVWCVVVVMQDTGARAVLGERVGECVHNERLGKIQLDNNLFSVML